MDNSLPKKSSLKGKKLIDMLFSDGKSIVEQPLRIVWMKTAFIDGNKVGFGVSKRFFKNAVDRNKVKRTMRECYRLNQKPIYDLDTTVAFMILYQGNTIPESISLEKTMQQILMKLEKAILK